MQVLEAEQGNEVVEKRNEFEVLAPPLRVENTWARVLAGGGPFVSFDILGAFSELWCTLTKSWALIGSALSIKQRDYYCFLVLWKTVVGKEDKMPFLQLLLMQGFNK